MSVVRIGRRHAFQLLCATGSNFSPGGPTQNYEVEVFIEGELREKTGMIINIRDMDSLIEEIVRPFTLNKLELTSGALAVQLFERMRPAMASFEARLIKLRLIENPDLWYDVWA